MFHELGNLQFVTKTNSFLTKLYCKSGSLGNVRLKGDVKVISITSNYETNYKLHRGEKWGKGAGAETEQIPFLVVLRIGRTQTML